MKLEQLFEELEKTIPLYSEAKAELAYLETYKHSLKAIKMAQSTETSVTAQEKEAYRSEEYQNHCKAIAAATEKTEALKWKLEVAKMRWETWRTLQATERAMERLTR